MIGAVPCECCVAPTGRCVGCPLTYAEWAQRDSERRLRARPCIMDCGLAAAPGDVYCPGCRSGVDR